LSVSHEFLTTWCWKYCAITDLLSLREHQKRCRLPRPKVQGQDQNLKIPD